MTPYMNGGDIIARVLQKQGVRFLFTLCGGHISPIFVSAQSHGIRVIDGGCPLMFGPTADFGHRMMRLVFAGHVPKQV